MKLFITILASLVLSSYAFEKHIGNKKSYTYRRNWKKAQFLLEHMTLNQKIGQLIQMDLNFLMTDAGPLNFSLIDQYSMGSVLVGGNGCPDSNGTLNCGDYKGATMHNWQKLMQKVNRRAVKVFIVENTTVEIKLITGTDAVHGNQHVLGEVLFPHNIGLAATHNAWHFAAAGYWTAKSVKESGFNYAFAPTVAVSHNPQWGRHYETMGSDPRLISYYANAYVTGAQLLKEGVMHGVLTSTKHFIGDGATFNGNDEGNAHAYNLESFYWHNVQGYLGAVEAETGTVMCSYSAINGVPMSLNQHAITGVLKEKIGFDGILISDYGEVRKDASQGLPTSWLKMSVRQSTCMMLNAGMDMFMFPFWIDGILDTFIADVKACLDEGDTHINRLDDAVRRILGVKIAMGLVDVLPNEKEEEEAPQTEESDLKESDSEVLEMLGLEKKLELDDIHKAMKNKTAQESALEAAEESLVLLKNDAKFLPLAQAPKYIVLAGERIIHVRDEDQTELFLDYDNIGAQNGGWSVRWQGFMGNRFWKGDLKEKTKAMSILDALKQTYPNTILLHANYQNMTDMKNVTAAREKFLDRLGNLNDLNANNTIIVAVSAEAPYAEFGGDVNNKYCLNQSKYHWEGCLYYSINPYLPDKQKTSLKMELDEHSLKVIKKVSNSSKIPQITVLLSGRPMEVKELLSNSTAFIAGFWPGTQGGEAIVNGISGKYLFRGRHKWANTLPEDWFKLQEDLQDYPVYDVRGNVPQIKQVLFKRGYGIRTKKRRHEESSQAENSLNKF